MWYYQHDLVPINCEAIVNAFPCRYLVPSSFEWLSVLFDIAGEQGAVVSTRLTPVTTGHVSVSKDIHNVKSYY